LDGKDFTESSPRTSDFEEILLRGIPAAYKNKKYDIVSPRHNLKAYIEHELNMETLEKIIGMLGFAGYLYPARPLHYQLSLGRNIVVTERIDMHLVLENAGKRIYMKPIPVMLLMPRFWTEYLACSQTCGCAMASSSLKVGEVPGCTQRKLRMTALGFLYSYTALISYESDFHVAKERHLLPSCVDWPQWQSLVYQLDTESIYPRIHPRFLYGELRTIRLDMLLIFKRQRLIPGFAGRWNQYSIFVKDNIAYIATATIFTALILSAMQVGLATSRLSFDESFQAASYGFAIFTIIFPLIFFGVLAIGVTYGLTVNQFALYFATQKRLKHIGANQTTSTAP
jgi:hypothetical protein